MAGPFHCQIIFPLFYWYDWKLLSQRSSRRREVYFCCFRSCPGLWFNKIKICFHSKKRNSKRFKNHTILKIYFTIPKFSFLIPRIRMPPAKTSSRKRLSDPDLTSSDQRKRGGDDLDIDLSDDLKGIVSALNLIRERAQKDDQKKNEETISSVASEIRITIEELKSKFEKDRQSFAKALGKSSKECENCLKNETTKFQALYEKFAKEKATHLQALKETITKFEEEKEKLFAKYEQLRKRERNFISEQERVCADKIAKLEESLKRKKQDDKTFSILRKTLGSFLETGSDEDFPVED